MATIDKNLILGKVQEILDKAHKPGPKRVIKENVDGIQFADPIGGDSKKNMFEKRAHLYWNSLFVICYDDDGYKMPLTDLCRTFHVDINVEQRLAIYEHIDSNITYKDYSDDYTTAQFDNLIDLEKLTETLNSGNCDSQIVNFKEIQKGSKQHRYLINRGVYNHKHIYQANYYRNSDWKEPIIVLLNKNDDKVLGCQVRNIKSGKYRMFKVYNYEQLLEWVSPELRKEMSDHDLVMYNKLSYYYNILNVDFMKTITLFEGYLDSIFFPNSIGMIGTNTDVNFIESNNLDIRYFYDNDKAGWRKSTEKINSGIDVFLWNKLFDTIIKGKKAKDPYSIYNKISKVKDLNQLATIVKNPYSTLKLGQFFSKDLYDKIWLPKVYRKKYYKGA